MIFLYMKECVEDIMSTKYGQVAEQLKRELIPSLSRGITKLPTEKELCDRFQVSRQTVRQALFLLESEGLIRRRQGSGAYLTGLLPGADSNRIALMLSTNTEYIFPALMSDLEDILANEGYDLSVHITHNQSDLERTILQTLIQNPPRGLIAEPSRSALPTPNYDLYEKLSSDGTDIVFLHGFYPNLPSSLYVKDDNFAGGFALGQLLIAQRHENIAGIFQLDTIQGQERHLGFQRAMIDAGLPYDENLTLWFTTRQLDLLEQKQDTRFLLDFIQKQLPSCSAVICHNDEIAYWLIKELSYTGLHIPEDISIVSFDNSYLSELSNPSLTSLTHEPHEMASYAASSLIQKMQGKNVSPIQLSWKLINRGSSMARE